MRVFLFLSLLVISVYGQKYEIAVDDVKLAVLERDESQPSNGYTTVKQGTKASQNFELSAQQKIQLKFVVKNKEKNTPVVVYQAFVALIHESTQREVIYVAEPEKKNDNAYAFELNLKTHQKDLSGLSGKYLLTLILGDFSITNPVNWHLADVKIKVPAVEPLAVPKSKEINYNKLPDIQHKFAQSEPRPPPIVSDTFALLCAFPLLVLFVLWLRVGINFGNLQISLWSLGFHCGLAAISGLYFWYWIQLNMFQTLQYLSVIATFTFVCGNRFLHNFNETKKQKTE